MRRGTEAGQAAVEFALVGVMLVVILLGVADLGRAVLAQASLSNAAREGARYAAIHWRDTDWQAQAVAAVQRSATTLDPASLTVTTATETSGGVQFQRVSASYVFHPIAPALSSVARTLTFSASVRMQAR